MKSSPWQYYLKLYRGSYRGLAVGILVSAVQSLLFLPIAALIKSAFDTVVPSGDFRRLALYGGLIVLLNLVGGAVTLWARRAAYGITKNVTRGLRDELLTRCYSYSRAYYSRLDRGRLHAALVNDTERVDAMSYALVVQLIPSALASVTLAALLVYLDWFLFLVLAAAAPVLLETSRRMKKRITSGHREYRKALKDYSQGTMFVLQMMDLTRIQSAEPFELQREREKLQRLRDKSALLGWLSTAYAEQQNAIVAIAGVIILIVGGRAVAAGSLTLGGLLSFYVLVGLMTGYLKNIWSAIPQIISGSESLAALHNTAHPDDSPPYTGKVRAEFHGEVRLEGVGFGYGDEKVLRDVSLHIPARTMVAVVGPNGSGKTTIAYLILGFYRPQQGGLWAGDHPYDELDILDLRRHIGVVMQDPVIFPGTIRDNITYGRPDSSSAEVVEASELATAHEFIRELPRGYQTLTGEGGMLLSGGQRQRIAVARALLRRPKLLILDEPTNHLDASSVQRLMNNLKTLETPPSILMISHDMDILRDARHIYLLRDGRLEPVNSADTLPSRSPLLSSIDL